MRISDNTLAVACRIPSDGTVTENTIHDLSFDLRDARQRIRELEQFVTWATPQIVTHGDDQNRIRELEAEMRKPAHEREPPHCPTCECPTNSISVSSK